MGAADLGLSACLNGRRGGSVRWAAGGRRGRAERARRRRGAGPPAARLRSFATRTAARAWRVIRRAGRAPDGSSTTNAVEPGTWAFSHIVAVPVYRMPGGVRTELSVRRA